MSYSGIFVLAVEHGYLAYALVHKTIGIFSLLTSNITGFKDVLALQIIVVEMYCGPAVIDKGYVCEGRGDYIPQRASKCFKNSAIS